MVHEKECHLRDFEHVAASRLQLSTPVKRTESRRKDDDQHHQRKFVFNNVVKHRHSRMNVKAQVAHSCAHSLNSLLRPQSCSRDIEDGLRCGRWVAAQKPSQQHLAGETQPTGGDRESNRSCPGPRDIKRCSQHSRYQAGPRSSLNQGPVQLG